MSKSCNNFHPLASRDMTVPLGIFKISAISLYESSSSSLRTIASLNSSGSFSIMSFRIFVFSFFKRIYSDDCSHSFNQDIIIPWNLTAAASTCTPAGWLLGCIARDKNRFRTDNNFNFPADKWPWKNFSGRQAFRKNNTFLLEISLFSQG